MNHIENGPEQAANVVPAFVMPERRTFVVRRYLPHNPNERVELSVVAHVVQIDERGAISFYDYIEDPNFGLSKSLRRVFNTFDEYEEIVMPPSSTLLYH